MYEAVTFDLWNTLISEGASGLIRPRSLRWHRTLLEHGTRVGLEQLDDAHRAALSAYQQAWQRNSQFRSSEATAAALDHLGMNGVEPHLHRKLSDCFHQAGLDCTIELAPHAIVTLSALRERGIRTAIICDIGLTPSSALRQLLLANGLLPLIDVECWSDERGVYKPDPSIFEWTLRKLGVSPSAAMHVGDRRRTDVAGARASGLASIRFAGLYNDAGPEPEADQVIDDLRDVVDLADPGNTADRSA